MMSQNRTVFAICVLFAINTMNFLDRQIPGAVGEKIKEEWNLSDTELGFVGTAFILLYAAIGVPLGRMADRGNRSWILAGGVFVWSLLTFGSGLARSFWQMVAFRLGVGVGEAACAPASNSLIGDLVPSSGRARALSLFMLGLPIGIALSYWISTAIAHNPNWGWRYAFYVALIPGLLCALGAMFIREPKRGGKEVHDIGGRQRAGSPYLLVLSIPTMRWIIASGALHNFNMYALGSFLVSFLIRVHGTSIQQAGLIVMVVYGLSGIPGLFVGGHLGDRIIRTRSNGRMLVAAVAITMTVPLIYLAIGRPVGDLVVFGVLMGLGCGLMYTYYSTVYSTIQDVIEPSLRGTAMALYFCAMYALGGALGPYGFGAVSDFFAGRAATAGGINIAGLSGDALKAALDPYKADGIWAAMYVIPCVCLALALVLFAGSLTVTRDAENLQRWMRESAAATKRPKGDKAPA
jgi:MFS family permease